MSDATTDYATRLNLAGVVARIERSNAETSAARLKLVPVATRAARLFLTKPLSKPGLTVMPASPL